MIGTATTGTTPGLGRAEPNDLSDKMARDGS